MKRITIISAFILIFSQLGYTQTMWDAYRLSNQRISGTARASGMGNAFGALGGDFTSLSINPAGIGVYRKSELVFTPVINFNYSEFNVNGTQFNDDKYHIKLNNIGFVSTYNTNSTNSGLVSFNFGLGYNNLVDFNQNFYGRNDDSSASFLDGIVNYANNESLSNDYLNRNIGQVEYRDWPTKLAWDTYLLDPALDANDNEIDGEYVSILYPNELVSQRKVYTQTGGINEFVVSGGLNFNHKLYLGATVGFQNVDLNQLTEYTETFGNNNSYTYGEDYSLEGIGYNLKLGAIFRPTDFIRLGAAFHTPTFYDLNEEKELFINSRLIENNSSSGLNVYDYNFLSPWKAILSGAIVFNKSGLISVDAEYLDYSDMRYRRSSRSSEDFSGVNNEISSNFESTLNIRVGGELKVTPNFSLRGGYEWYPNAQIIDQNATEEYFYPVALDNSTVWAAGLGYASNGFFTDITFRNVTDKYSMNEIQPNFQDMALKNSNNKILLTVGFKF